MPRKARVYESGAVKRKRQQLREKDNMKIRKVMDAFLKGAASRTAEAEVEEQRREVAMIEECGEDDNMHEKATAKEEHDAVGEMSNSDEDEDSEGGVSHNSQGGARTAIESDMEGEEGEQHPTITHADLGYLAGPPSDELRALILEKGSLYFQNSSRSAFPKQNIYGKQRGLTKEVFKMKLPDGHACNRSWLTYSPRLEALFCFPCLLYSTAPEQAKSSLAKTGVGFTKMRKNQEKVKEHEAGVFHRQAVIAWKLEEEQVKPEADEFKDLVKAQVLQQMSTWKEILKRVAATIVFLAKQNLALRGHREDRIGEGGEGNKGNFLEALHYLAQFDPVMQNHLESIKPGKVHYLSPTIQNEFIEIMGRTLQEKIVKDIKDARFFSIMIDSTPDISHQEQVSFVIRILDAKLQIKEKFLGYYVIEKPDAAHYQELVLKTLAGLGIDFGLCRGQTYDNAATMSGERSGLQKRLTDINPKAVFINCDNHSLNLAAMHSAEVDPSVVTFFALVQETFIFFSSSPQRWAKMRAVCSRNLRMASTTRWSSREDAAATLNENLNEIITVLEEIADSNEEHQETRSKARTLVHGLMTFSFFAFLSFWAAVLRSINLAHKRFQQPDVTIQEASEEFEKLFSIFDSDDIRTKIISDAIKKARDGSESYGYPTERRPRKKRRMPGEEAEDASLSLEQEFRRIAFAVYDRLKHEILDRSKRIRNFIDTFGFLLQTQHLLRDASENYLKSSCERFAKVYDEVDALGLYHNVTDARLLFEKAELPTSPTELLRRLRKYGEDTFVHLNSAVRILLTIFVSVASCERSFSKLKLVKTYLRSSMSQQRLKYLALMSVEAEELEKMDMNMIITKFAEEKVRIGIPNR